MSPHPVLLGPGLGGLVPLFLRHLLVLARTVLGVSGALLRGTLALHRRVARHVARSFLAAAEEFVHESHVPSS